MVLWFPGPCFGKFSREPSSGAMAKKAVDDTKAKIEQLRLQLHDATPTVHQLMEHLGISENIANLVLQRMFLESPSKVTAASEDSGSATSKGGMPNKKAKAAALLDAATQGPDHCEEKARANGGRASAGSQGGD